MNYEERRVFVAEYLGVQREAQELLAYKQRYDAFRGFISQGVCERIVPSREPSNGKTGKHFFIVKKPTQPILVVKLPLYGAQPDTGDTLYWAQPRDRSDEVSLLAIKKPDGSVKVLKDHFKNAQGKRCETIFFVDEKRNYLSVQVKLDQLREYLLSNKDAFAAALEEQDMAKEIKRKNGAANKAKVKSI